MDYVRLGSTGLRVSRLCLGTMTYGTSSWRPWILDEAASRPFIERALELGINFFDTADMYSLGASEEVVGRALRDMAKRHEYVLATKVYEKITPDANGRGLSRKHIMEAIDGSLRRLGVDYVDLYQIHRFDADTPVEETMEALHDVVRAGKALYIGASSMYAWQFAKMIHIQRARGWAQFVSMQNHYNLVYREEEREMIPLCRAEGIGLLPWSPLARGFLAGNRKRESKDATLRETHDHYGHSLYYAPEDYDIADRVVEVARRKGVLPIQIALAWVVGRPGVTAPVIGVSRLEQFEPLIDALSIELDAEDRQHLEESYVPHGVIGHS